MKSLKEKIGLVFILVVVGFFVLCIVLVTQFPSVFGGATKKVTNSEPEKKKNQRQETDRSGFVSDTVSATKATAPVASQNERISGLEQRIVELQRIVEKQTVLLDAQKKFTEKFLLHIKETGALDTTVEKRMSWIELELELVNTKVLQLKNTVHLLTRQLSVQKGK